MYWKKPSLWSFSCCICPVKLLMWVRKLLKSPLYILFITFWVLPNIFNTPNKPQKIESRCSNSSPISAFGHGGRRAVFFVSCIHSIWISDPPFSWNKGVLDLRVKRVHFSHLLHTVYIHGAGYITPIWPSILEGSGCTIQCCKIHDQKEVWQRLAKDLQHPHCELVETSWESFETLPFDLQGSKWVLRKFANTCFWTNKILTAFTKEI